MVFRAFVLGIRRERRDKNPKGFVHPTGSQASRDCSFVAEVDSVQAELHERKCRAVAKEDYLLAAALKAQCAAGDRETKLRKPLKY